MPDAMEIHTIHAKNRERKQNNNSYDRRFNGILDFSAFLRFQKIIGMETLVHKNN